MKEECRGLRVRFLVVLLLLLLVLGLMRVESSKGYNGNNGGMVRVNGTQMTLGDGNDPFYWNGFNAYWLMVMASIDAPKVRAVFEEARSHGLTVARTLAFSDAGRSPLQSSPGVYNETMFRGLDFVVCEAGKYGIKLILSLVNNYPDFGGKPQYVDWVHPNQNLSPDLFFTDPQVKQIYKNHVQTVLRRKNSINGVIYKDDPTIMAWELMNEPRCESDSSGNTIQGWIGEMAAFVKSIDDKHLLEIGLEGFYGKANDARNQGLQNAFQYGTDFISNNQIPQIDFATLHAYPDAWLSGSDEEAQLSFMRNWIKTHVSDAEKTLGKPLVVAEFGMNSSNPGFSVHKRDTLFATVYRAIFDSAKGGGAAAGGMFWQLLAEGMDSLRDGYEVILRESASTATVIGGQSERVRKLSEMHARVKSMEEEYWAKENHNIYDP